MRWNRTASAGGREPRERNRTTEERGGKSPPWSRSLSTVSLTIHGVLFPGHSSRLTVFASFTRSLPVPSVVGSGSVLILFPLPSPSPTERALRGEWSGDGKVRRGTEESDKGRRYHSHFTPSLSSLVTHPSLTLFTRSHPSPRYTRRAAGREGTDRANA